MKYRWSINVMTRTAGVLTVYCKDKEQAARNIIYYRDSKHAEKDTITFDSLSQLPNILLMSEIIAITCCDLEMMYDVHMEDVKLHKQMERDIDLSIEKDDY